MSIVPRRTTTRSIPGSQQQPHGTWPNCTNWLQGATCGSRSSSGVELSYPDIAGQIERSENFVAERHGTEVTGIIAAGANDVALQRKMDRAGMSCRTTENET